MRSGLGVKIIPLPNRYCSYSFQNIFFERKNGAPDFSGTPPENQ
jgi:hypothetical protein